MALQVAIPKETTPGENRVAMVPQTAERLAKLGMSVAVERAAGAACGIPDSAYSSFASLADDAERLYREADIVLRVETPEPGQIRLMREGVVLISFVQARNHRAQVELLRDQKVTSFAMELVPRITRAQNVDALSSQATVAGYEGALLGATRLQRFFPLLTTAAGTIRPAKVLVIGAGVAGLQAIATAHRLGAQVEGYDVRAASREEVESLGAKFVMGGIKAEGEGGYARELTEAEKQAQQELLADHLRLADVVICTASVPGHPAPKIILKPMVDRMKSGAVIVDLAADAGGNCELTEPGREVIHAGVTVLGPVNVPSLLAEDASRMYSNNVYNFLSLLVRDGQVVLDWSDEIISQMVLTYAGTIKQETIRRWMEGESE